MQSSLEAETHSRQEPRQSDNDQTRGGTPLLKHDALRSALESLPSQSPSRREKLRRKIWKVIAGVGLGALLLSGHDSVTAQAGEPDTAVAEETSHFLDTELADALNLDYAIALTPEQARHIAQLAGYPEGIPNEGLVLRLEGVELGNPTVFREMLGVESNLEFDWALGTGSNISPHRPDQMEIRLALFSVGTEFKGIFYIQAIEDVAEWVNKGTVVTLPTEGNDVSPSGSINVDTQRNVITLSNTGRLSRENGALTFHLNGLDMSIDPLIIATPDGSMAEAPHTALEVRDNSAILIAYVENSRVRTLTTPSGRPLFDIVAVDALVYTPDGRSIPITAVNVANTAIPLSKDNRSTFTTLNRPIAEELRPAQQVELTLAETFANQNANDVISDEQSRLPRFVDIGTVTQLHDLYTNANLPLPEDRITLLLTGIVADIPSAIQR